MRKIVEYIMIQGAGGSNNLAENRNGITQVVNRYIAMGWQPLGGVSSHLCNNTFAYHQAMVRYEGYDDGKTPNDIVHE